VKTDVRIICFFGLLCAAESHTMRHVYSNSLRKPCTASNHDRHQPTVHCAPLKMAATGVSKRLKGPTLEGDKKINSPGKAVFLF